MGNILLDVVILGEPIGKGAPRAVNTPMGARVHPAKNSDRWESLAAQQVAAMVQRPAYDGGPLRITVEAVHARPKTVPRRLGSGALWRTSKPDLSNVLKSAEDAIVKAGVLRDDALIAEVRATKRVAGVEETPHVHIVLEELDPLPLIPWPEKPRGKVARPAAGSLL